MNYGEPIPSDKKIEATQFFDQETLGRLLIKHVADSRLPQGQKGPWGGHITLHVQDGFYNVTVSVWKELR